MRVDSQPAYVLHTRDYRDSSLLVELITPNYGRVSAVVRGVRSTAKSAKQRRSMMQPFQPLLISWTGNSELKTATSFENRAVSLALSGTRLFSALYVNELLSRLLRHCDESSELFALYEWVLQSLVCEERIDVVLRRFELSLLENLGYGIDLHSDAATGLAIDAAQVYRFDAERGFVLSADGQAGVAARSFAGRDLLAIGAGEFDSAARRSAKRLCRLAIEAQLGGKPLKSRELFT